VIHVLSPSVNSPVNQIQEIAVISKVLFHHEVIVPLLNSHFFFYLLGFITFYNNFINPFPASVFLNIFNPKDLNHASMRLSLKFSSWFHLVKLSRNHPNKGIPFPLLMCIFLKIAKIWRWLTSDVW
jgi:hypothetical protein